MGNGTTVSSGSGPTSNGSSNPYIMYFDIDNCLYSKSKRIYQLMEELIDAFFVRHLEISREDALMLHKKYYTQYGLAIEGLARHHKIKPLEFNREVDDALPLDDILHPDPHLRALLESFDRSKVTLWLFTNAHVTHGMRVVKLLGIDDLFDGITYCDYNAEQLLCKPAAEMFEKAERQAGAKSPSQCYFVDDSALNCKHAQARGWETAHLVEEGEKPPEQKAAKYQIKHLDELRDLFPHLFKSN